jgi:hypothetical protein
MDVFHELIGEKRPRSGAGEDINFEIPIILFLPFVKIRVIRSFVSFVIRVSGG